MTEIFLYKNFVVVFVENAFRVEVLGEIHFKNSNVDSEVFVDNFL